MDVLLKLVNYSAHLNVPSNSLRNHSVPMNTAGGTDHVFVNGNLARSMLAVHVLVDGGTKAYGEQGLAWCDTLCDLQASTTSSRGRAAGYWGAGYGEPASCTARPLSGDCAAGGEIYLGDTGTAATVLGLCYKISSDAKQRARYLDTMEKFATFLLEGTAAAPVNKKGTVGPNGFVHSATGAVGCGYYRCSTRTSESCSAVPGPAALHCPSLSPYTISTGTSGAAFFSELYAITRNATYAAVAEKAVAYLSSVALASGEVPYILDGANCTTAECPAKLAVGGPWPFDTISYVTEGVAAYALTQANGSDARSTARRSALLAQWEATVAYLVRTQEPSGVWGAMGSGDQQRSPRCLTLLSWWLVAAPGDTASVKKSDVRRAGECLLVTVTFYANLDHNLTCSP
jgi:hypothetical protein